MNNSSGTNPEVASSASKAGTPSEQVQVKPHDLFGGAFRIERFPVFLRDISDFVPISDNQEIFSDVSESNPAYSGNQLIFEVLDRTDKPNTEAVQFNFHDLAEESNSKDPIIQSVAHFQTKDEVAQIMPKLSFSGCKYTLHTLKGTQRIIPNKKTNAERDFVTMLMCLIRLEQPYSTDILITFNIPDKISDEDESSQKTETGQSQQYIDFLT